MTSCAPRLAERNARPATQAGINRPERKKSVLVRMWRFKHKADPEDEGEIDDQNGAVDQTEVNGLHRKSGQPELQPLAQNSRWQCHLRECERFQRNAHDESLTGSASRRDGSGP